QRGEAHETRLRASTGKDDRKALLAQPRGTERHAGVSRLARARIPRGRGPARGRRMVAPRFPEIDGRLDGPGGFWPNELSASGSAPGSVHQECRVVDPGKGWVLCN